MAHDGFGIGVKILGIRIDDPVTEQVVEATFPEVRGIPTQQITAQPIDGQLENKPRLCCSL
jgi:hypothetical protein